MSAKAQAIEEALRRLNGAERFFGKKEVKELPQILWEDELPERIIQGVYNNGQGILVATNKRLVFVDKGLLWGLRVEDFPYDKISSIEYKTGLMFGELVIYTSGNRSKIEQVLKDQVREFAEFVRARMTAVSAHKSAAAANATSASSQTSAGSDDLMAQLERLGRLKEQGLIDEVEFKAAKAKLLNL